MILFSRTFIRKRAISLATTATVAATSFALAQDTSRAYHLHGAVPLQYVADRPDLADEQSFLSENDAAMNKMMKEGQQAQDTLGRALTPVEQYMVHQQGLYGALAHISNPDDLAWKNFQKASGNSEAKSKEAVWGNLTAAQQAEFGSVDKMTSRDFIKTWQQRYDAL